MKSCRARRRFLRCQHALADHGAWDKPWFSEIALVFQFVRTYFADHCQVRLWLALANFTLYRACTADQVRG